MLYRSLPCPRLIAKLLAALVFMGMQSCSSGEFTPITSGEFTTTTSSTASPIPQTNENRSALSTHLPTASASPFSALSQTDSSNPDSPILVHPPVDNCTINMALINDPDAPLNVRSTPDIQENNIVGKLENHTFVSVAEETDGWFKIESPITGWIAKNRTENSCAFVEEIIPITPETNTALVQGKIIGTGSHRYKVKLEAGQTLTIDNYQSVMPMVISPEEKLLTQDGNPTVTHWLLQAPSTGDYTLQFDSNYQGFGYEFLVTVQ